VDWSRLQVEGEKAEEDGLQFKNLKFQKILCFRLKKIYRRFGESYFMLHSSRAFGLLGL